MYIMNKSGNLIKKQNKKTPQQNTESVRFKSLIMNK